MTRPEKFLLKWNDFQPNLYSGLRAALKNEEFVDVTLAAEGESLRAHKLILSMSSLYFQKVLKENKCEHPIVIIKDVKFAQLRQIIDFVYHGEVNIPYDDLTTFLEAGDQLQIKGLIRSSDAPANVSCEKIQLSESEVRSVEISTPSGSRGPPWKIETIATPATNVPKDDQVTQVPDVSSVVNITQYPVLTQQLTSEVLKPNEFYLINRVRCKYCDRLFANRYNLKVHVRDKHNVVGKVVCEICNKPMRNISCLRVHLYNHRKRNVALDEPSTSGTVHVTDEAPSGSGTSDHADDASDGEKE